MYTGTCRTLKIILSGTLRLLKVPGSPPQPLSQETGYLKPSHPHYLVLSKVLGDTLRPSLKNGSPKPAVVALTPAFG